jgi:uncharacterized repeat protein (TIGR01451 family)
MRSISSFRLAMLVISCLFLVPAAVLKTEAQTVTVSSFCWNSNAFNSLVRWDTLMIASTPGNKYYRFDLNYNYIIDSLPDIGSHTPSFKRLVVGRDGGLYALTDTVVMRRSAAGWVNTGFAPPNYTNHFVVDNLGAIWSLSYVPGQPTSAIITRFFNGAVTHTFPFGNSFYFYRDAFAADDSGGVWLTGAGLHRIDTTGITLVYADQSSISPMVGSNNQLYFFTNSGVMTGTSAGVSLFHTLPANFFWNSTVAFRLYQDTVHLYSSNWWTQTQILHKVTSSQVISDTIVGLFVCSDSSLVDLQFDPLGRIWVMGFATASTGHLYIVDTLLVPVIGGKIFHDFNQNGIFDGSDIPLQGIMVHNTVTNQTVYTDVNGDYTMPLPAIIGRQWSVNITLPAPWYLTSQHATYSQLAMPGVGPMDLDFGVNAPPINPNIAAYGFSLNLPPGFTSLVNCYAQNISTSMLTNIDAWFIYPTIFDTCYSQVPPVSHTQQTLHWVIDTLYPLASRMFPLSLPMDSLIVIGTVFQMTFYVNHPLDINPLDDTIVWRAVVANSYDPNDKLVYPDRPENTIAPDELLTYTIRFQNTGTSPAINVVLKDTLSPFLDLSTLTFIGSSHRYTYAMNPGNELVITYTDIQLPDSANYPAESMGAITFTLKPLPGMADGTTIHNEAFIYFDFNLPIQTNQTTSIISTISTEEKSPLRKPVTVWPNPAKDRINISHPGIYNNTPYSITLYDISGRRADFVKTSESVNSFELDLTGLKNGIYIGILEINGTITPFRVVKQNPY